MNTTIDSTPTDPRFVSVRTLSSRYDVSASTIWRWLRTGVLPKEAIHRLGPTSTRFDVVLCDRALELTKD